MTSYSWPMWGNNPKSSSKALTHVSTAAPRTWSWDDTDHPDSLESTSFSTSIDLDETPSSPGYTVLAGVTSGDPVESAIAEWEMDLGLGVTSDDSFDSTLCVSEGETKQEEGSKLKQGDESMMKRESPLKQEDSFSLDERPVKKGKGKAGVERVTKQRGSRVKRKVESRVQSRVQTRAKTRSKAVVLPPRDQDFPSLSLTLTRITCESAFHHRFLQCEDQLHTLAEEYLRYKRHGLPWTNPTQMDHALFDWAFVSRKSGLPRETAVHSLREVPGGGLGVKRPVRWTPVDDRLILYLKEIEGLTWKESALMIRYRHSWQAVQMRYLRTLCRLTGKWTPEETAQLQSIVARDWAGRWKRIATEMGPQFPVERVYRHMKGLAGMEVDLERLDEVDGERSAERQRGVERDGAKDVERKRDVRDGRDGERDEHQQHGQDAINLYCR